MMSDARFVILFSADASKQNKDPIELAKKEIEEIDDKLKEAEQLKLRRMKLIKVLEHFGDDTHRRRRSVNVPRSEDIDYSSEELKVLQQKIKDAVSEGPINVHDLITKVGSYDQDTLIMRTVKWLGDQEIVSRDDQGRVQPGKNW